MYHKGKEIQLKPVIELSKSKTTAHMNAKIKLFFFTDQL